MAPGPAAAEPATPGPNGAPPQRQPDALKRDGAALSRRLPPLLAEALKVARSVAPGAHGRRQPGLGETFWQFRRYEPGDPPGAIDWRQTAKRGFVAVRETEWAAAQSLWLFSARHAGMGYRSSPNLPAKQERADLLLVATADLLLRGGERVGLADPEKPLFRPAYGRAVVERIAHALALAPARDDCQAPGVMPPAPVPRHGRIVAFTDALDRPADFESALIAYAGEGVGGIIVQVLDPAEAELPFQGRVRFTDPLASRAAHLVPRVESVRSQYRQRLAHHQAELGELCRRNGWSFLIHRTDQPAQKLLLALFAQLGSRPLFPGGRAG